MRRLALIALLTAACAEEARPGAPAPGGGGGPTAPAGDSLPRRRDLAQNGHVGRVLARDSTEVAALGEGRLKVVYVRMGDFVEAGAKIAELDDNLLRKELAVARATMRAARAARDQAEAERDEARQRLGRRKALGGNVSKEEIADAEFSEKKALAALARADAMVSEQKARVDQIEETLEDTVIRAPFRGKIAARFQDGGALVGPGTPIVRLISSEDLLVRFAAAVEEIADFQVGGKVLATLEDLEVAIPGEIRQISPEVEPGSNVVLIEATLEIPAEWRGRIQSGLAARVKLIEPPATGQPATPEARP